MAAFLDRVDAEYRQKLLRQPIAEVEIEPRQESGRNASTSGLFLALGPNAVERVAEIIATSDPSATLSAPPASPQNVARQIGPYRLLQQIGEGGMGTVWMAEQKSPVRRTVALENHQGRHGDLREVIARFEAERQALALMDHPNIAKVLDAGETAQGRP